MLGDVLAAQRLAHKPATNLTGCEALFGEGSTAVQDSGQVQAEEVAPAEACIGSNIWSARARQEDPEVEEIEMCAYKSETDCWGVTSCSVVDSWAVEVEALWQSSGAHSTSCSVWAVAG